MYLLESLTQVLSLLFLVTAMAGAGLKTSLSDLAAFWRSTDILLRIIIANFLAVPVIGVVIVQRIGFSPELSAAFALLAFTPGGIAAIPFTTRIKDSEPLAGAMTIVLSLLAIFFSPAMLEWVMPEKYPVDLAYGPAVIFVVASLILPMAAGMWIRSRHAALAARLAPWALGISMPIFLLVLGRIYMESREIAHDLALEHIWPMLLFILLAMTAGWLAGGPSLSSRASVTIGTGMRNIILALLISLHTFNNRSVEAHLAAFSLLMIGVNAAFALGVLLYLKAKSEKGKVES
jgi:BASS family bile acid:Na+ symporter